jgi:hypothetical protein
VDTLAELRELLSRWRGAAQGEGRPPSPQELAQALARARALARPPEGGISPPAAEVAQGLADLCLELARRHGPGYLNPLQEPA